MDRDEIKESYFTWLCSFIIHPRYHIGVSYYKLLKYLHGREFTYLMKRDSNRAEDGIALRWRFVCDSGLDICFDEVDKYIPGPCSVFEMILALAIRCEEQIMDDAAYGNRIRQWFWKMLDTMGLGYMSDDIFDLPKSKKIVTRFLNREYEPNGRGGLFIVEGSHDLRYVEIWMQLCWYLDSRI